MATEKSNWPIWLKEIWPTWLEGTGYPVAGVGDLDDLQLVLGVGDGGRWVGYINPGWYYHNNSEQYNYVQVGTTTVTGATGSGTISESISFRPSWGPVQIHGISDDASGVQDGPYREHHNSLYPAYAPSWSVFSSGAGIYSATLPVSTVLVGLRDLTSLPLGSVAGTGLVTNSRLYYYDIDNRVVYIKPKDTSNIEIWADILYTYPKLRFRELVINEQDASGNMVVRPTYSQIENIRVIRGNQTYSVSGYFGSGYLTHALTGTVTNDWIVLDYWISKSFILTNHQTIQYYCGGSAGSGTADSFTVYYETSVPDILPNISVNVPSSGIWGIFNINPQFEFGYRTGYLFHANPASSINSYWSPSKLYIYSDKDTVCGSWNEAWKVKVLVTADNDIPIPYYTVTVVVSGGSSLVTYPANRTDGKGEMHYLIQPSAVASSLTMTVTCGSLSGIVTATIVTSAQLINLSKWRDGHVNVLVTNEKTGRGAFRTFVNAIELDGMPRAHNGLKSINIFSKLASEFHLGSAKTTTKYLETTQDISIANITAMSEIGYVPQPNDTLFAYSATAISKLIGGN